MNRSEMREQAFVLLFEKEFFSELTCNDIEEIYSENFSELSDYAKKAFKETSARIDELDELIKKYLKGWKLERIPKVNISILRLALYEINYEDGVPGKVAVNEAVELAKKYSGEDDYMFINGVLGSYLREEAK